MTLRDRRIGDWASSIAAAEVEAEAERKRVEGLAQQQRLISGQLTQEERAAINALARSCGHSASDIEAAARKMALAMQPTAERFGEAMTKLGETVAKALDTQAAKSLHRKTAEEKRRQGIPLEMWSTSELMAYLPEKASQTKDPSGLDDFQAACLTQHVLNNCSQQDAVSYDGALQITYVPDLLRRLLKRTETPATKMRMAWALYRSGAATLEEITPLMDQADEEAAEPSPSPPTAESKPAPEHGPADGLYRGTWCGTTPSRGDARRMRPERIPRALAQVGGQLVADGVPYRVKQHGSVRYPNTALLQELKPNGQTFGGAAFWVQIV